MRTAKDKDGNLIYDKLRVPCIRHLFRNVDRMYVTGMEHDCTTCVPNEDNDNCPMYDPVSLVR